MAVLGGGVPWNRMGIDYLLPCWMARYHGVMRD
jgi:hypothetical protein